MSGYTEVWECNDEMVSSMLALLNLTNEQVDAWFVEANNLM